MTRTKTKKSKKVFFEKFTPMSQPGPGNDSARHHSDQAEINMRGKMSGSFRRALVDFGLARFFVHLALRVRVRVTIP